MASSPTTTTRIASLLWPSQRTYQVFGANTDVGKTIFTTLLCTAATKLWAHDSVTFLKPVSTGPDDEADDRCTYIPPYPSKLRTGDHKLTPSDRCIFSHLNTFAPGVSTAVLFKYGIPVSPHLAAQASDQTLPTDSHLLVKCHDFAAHLAARKANKGWLFLETAGGVHSPTPSGTTQADLYTPLRVPAVLVGDSRLGGISQTISAFESLHIRGYDVESVLLFDNAKYGNLDYLTRYFRDRYERILVAGVAAPPARHASPQQDLEAMKHYYTAYGTEGNTTKTVLQRLDQRHDERVASLKSMASRAHRNIWWPFTQQSLLQPKDITVIDSAHGDYFQTLIPQGQPAVPTTTTDRPDQSSQQGLLRSSFDGSASWWTQGLGHGNPQLTLAAAHAAGRYGHVMFASAIHKPALELAEALLRAVQNPRLARVFYTDNGSTGVEVAIKMALRSTRVRYHPGEEAADAPENKLGVVGLKGSYHGDTMGAMDSSEPCAFNEKTEWYQGRGYWFDYPTVLCADGKWQTVVPGELEAHLGRGQGFDSLNDIFDVATRESRNEHLAYETYIQKTLQDLRDRGHRFGALILEPVVLGAGGMVMVDPLFQRALVNVVRRSPHLFKGPAAHGLDTTAQGPHEWTGLPVVFDEVFTGIYRLGRFTAASLLGVHPDISVHAKLLTGGLVPLCTTLASESIFGTFSRSQDKTDALLHGHSYTAHPVGCQVAVESLRQMAGLAQGGHWDWAQRRNGWWIDDNNHQDNNNNRVWSVWPRDLVDHLSRQTGRVMGAWALGSVLAIHLRDQQQDAGYVSNAAVGHRDALLAGEGFGGGDGAQGSWNVHCRVLGNVLYLMAGQTTTEASVDDIGRLLRQNIG